MNNMRKPPLSPTHNFLGIQRTCFKGILKGKKGGLPVMMPNVVKTCSLQPLRRSASESEVAEVYKYKAHISYYITYKSERVPIVDPLGR